MMRKRLHAIWLILFTSVTLSLNAQQIIPLYKGIIPNSKPSANIETSSKDSKGHLIISKISVPTLTIFLPVRAKANGTAVIICPGGGYWVNAYKHEGADVALELNKAGIAAFVLKYRLPDESIMDNTAIGPLQDVQQAMLMVRTNAARWHIAINKVGVMGFSAGGHLAATLGTHYEKVLVPDEANIPVKPDFMILAYPLISGDTTIARGRPLERLLGKDAPQELVDNFSNEKQVTAATPPTFLVQAGDDTLTVEHTLAFYKALLRRHVPSELHIYQAGDHGFGLNNPTTSDKWLDLCLNWMRANKWLPVKEITN